MAGNTELEPGYSLVPVVRTPRIDPGDTLEVEVYVTGYGPVENGKIYVRYPHGLFEARAESEPADRPPEAADDESIGEFRYTARWITDEYAGIFASPAEPGREYKEIRRKARRNTSGGVIDADPLFQAEGELWNAIEDGDLAGNEWNESELLDPMRLEEPEQETVSGGTVEPERYPAVIGERSLDRDDDRLPPCSLALHVKSRGSLLREVYRRYWPGSVAPDGEQPSRLHGDYDIQFVLSYVHDGTVYQDRAAAPFHVNSSVETHRPLFEVAGILVLVIGLASLVLQAVRFAL